MTTQPPRTRPVTRILDPHASPHPHRNPRRRTPDYIGRDEFFHPQPSAREALPPPEPLLEKMALCVVEILSGAREVEQIARWVTDDVYQNVLKRTAIAARARRLRGRSASRPAFTVGRTLVCEPRDGVIEAVVMVNNRQRGRAVAIRLEGLDGSWRASAITVL